MGLITLSTIALVLMYSWLASPLDEKGNAVWSVYSYGCGVLVVFYIRMCDGAVHCGTYLFNRMDVVLGLRA